MSTDTLDDVTGSGTFHVERADSTVELRVVEAGPVGIRLEEVHVRHPTEAVERRMRRLERSRALPERVTPIEVEAGRGLMRTAPEDLTGRGFFELDVQSEHTRIRRVQLDDGDRSDGDFALTREALEALLTDLAP